MLKTAAEWFALHNCPPELEGIRQYTLEKSKEDLITHERWQELNGEYFHMQLLATLDNLMNRPMH